MKKQGLFSSSITGLLLTILLILSSSLVYAASVTSVSLHLDKLTVEKNGNLEGSGSIIGSGSGMITYTWCWYRPGEPVGSTAFSTPMTNGAAVVSEFNLPTANAGQYSIWVTVTSPVALISTIYFYNVTEAIRVATPTFQPSAGTYPGPQAVTVTCPTSEATIRYTTDGSDPNSSSTLYSGPLTVSSNVTIKARCFKDGLGDSDIGIATYSIRVETPTFTPAGGTYPGTRDVEIDCATVGAEIRYTMDGTVPTSSSALYPGPLSVSSTMTIKARAFKKGMVDSNTTAATFIIIPKVAAPGFSPEGGTYSGVVTANIFCSTGGATIFYTTDGSYPSSTSTLYTGPITVSSTMTLTARAFRSGMIASDVTSATYTVPVILKVATPTFSPRDGTHFGAQTVTIACSTEGAEVHYTTDGSDPAVSSPLYNGPLAILSDTTLKARAFKAGMLESDVAHASYEVITKLPHPVISPDGGTYLSPVAVSISCPVSGATICYTMDGTDPTSSSPRYTNPITISATTTLKAKTFKSGMAESDISITTFTITPKVATPIFSPGAGIYPGERTVSISCETSGAAIRYTTDGTYPTSTSTLYIAPFTISSTATVKARAFKSGLLVSDVATATYTIIPQVEDPVFTPGSGTYSDSQTVTITCGTSGATIRYTTDGSFPASSSRIYSAPVYISGTTTLRARALKSGMMASNVPTAIYTIVNKVATPVFFPEAGIYPGPRTVTINCPTIGSTIRYTMDGSNPTSSSPVYTAPLVISSTTNLKAKAFRDAMPESDIAVAIYTITRPKVAAPSLNPGTGTYAGAQTLTISCATNGATIRFTTDGSDPTSSSKLYTGPFSIPSPMTIKAYASKSEMTDSDITVENYIITPPRVATPTFSPPGETYSGPQTVTISCATSGATIRFTTDGTYPTSSSTVYLLPLTISSNTTVIARAFKSGMLVSDTATASYSIIGLENQSPTGRPATGPGRILNIGTGLCLRGDTSNTPSNVFLAPCDDTEVFHIRPDGTISTDDDICLDISNDLLSPVTTLNYCSGEPGQKWSLRLDGFLFNPQLKIYATAAENLEGPNAPVVSISKQITAGQVQAQQFIFLQPAEKVFQCFGAAGISCSGTTGAPAGARSKVGRQMMYVSVGSIAHDNCCLQNSNDPNSPEGISCKKTEYLFPGPNNADWERPCMGEWIKAWNDSAKGMQWQNLFGPYDFEKYSDNLTESATPNRTLSKPTDDGRMEMTTLTETISSRRLKAPDGTRLEKGDQDFCESENWFYENPLDPDSDIICGLNLSGN